MEEHDELAVFAVRLRDAVDDSTRPDVGLIAAAGRRRRRRARSALALGTVVIAAGCIGLIGVGAKQRSHEPDVVSVAAAPQGTETTSTPSTLVGIGPVDGQVSASWLPGGYHLRGESRRNDAASSRFQRSLGFTLSGKSMDEPGAGLLRVEAVTGDGFEPRGKPVSAAVPGGQVFVLVGGPATNPTTVSFASGSTYVAVSSVELPSETLIHIAEGLRLEIADCSPAGAANEDCADGLTQQPADGGYSQSAVTQTTTKANLPGG